MDVSTHAPVKARREGLGREPRPRRCFNPRAREGATYRCGGGALLRERFNPRAREGATSVHRVGSGWLTRFQPTRP